MNTEETPKDAPPEQPSGASASPRSEPEPDSPAAEGEELSEDEIRARLEEEIKEVRVEDVILQSTVSILNLTARRIAKEDERDLEQARVGIEACRALVGLLPEEAQKQVREALSELQMLYAKQASESPSGDSASRRPEPEPAAPGVEDEEAAVDESEEPA